MAYLWRRHQCHAGQQPPAWQDYALGRELCARHAPQLQRIRRTWTWSCSSRLGLTFWKDPHVEATKRLERKRNKGNGVFTVTAWNYTGLLWTWKTVRQRRMLDWTYDLALGEVLIPFLLRLPMHHHTMKASFQKKPTTCWPEGIDQARLGVDRKA